jgi:hypothetical protein
VRGPGRRAVARHRQHTSRGHGQAHRAGPGDGLDFSVGGYGDDGSDRADLVRLARKRASEKYGHDFAGTRAVVIGDTPHDVRGALDADALAVGVASGRHTSDELRQAGAHVVLAGLTEFADRCGKAFGW